MKVMDEKNNLYIFDFDKTLIKDDSFRIFTLLGSEKIWKKIFVLLFALWCKVGLISNQKYKELCLKTIWLPKTEIERNILLEKFYSRLNKIEYSIVVNILKTRIKMNEKVIVLSASPEFYLKPYVRSWSEKIEVFGSKVQYENGKFKFTNLYSAEKAACAISIINKKKPKNVWVYADHVSDLPIIKLADSVCLVNPSTKLCKKLHQLKIKYEIINNEN